MEEVALIRHLSIAEMYHRKYIRCFVVSVTFFSVLLILYLPIYHQVHSQDGDSHAGSDSSIFHPSATLVLSRVRSMKNDATQFIQHMMWSLAGKQTKSKHNPKALQGWSVNTSRDLRLYVQPDNVTTIIPQPEICRGDVFLLVIVCSAVNNFQARSVIRETWGSVSNSSSGVRVAFLLGDPDNFTLQEQVAEESLQFGDVIQEGFLDTYNNLTLKSVMMLKWVNTYCPSLNFLMKTDDDMFVSVDNLVKLLAARGTTTSLLIGTLICGAKPISDSNSKWYTPRYMYSGRIYPNYLSGTGYVMSRDVVTKLYRAALETPLFHLEDVYLTGMCARSAGIRPRDHSGFTYVRRRPDACLFRHRTVITSHHITPTELKSVWTAMHAPDLDCSTFTLPTTHKPTSKRNTMRRANRCF